MSLEDRSYDRMQLRGGWGYYWPPRFPIVNDLKALALEIVEPLRPGGDPRERRMLPFHFIVRDGIEAREPCPAAPPHLPSQGLEGQNESDPESKREKRFRSRLASPRFPEL